MITGNHIIGASLLALFVDRLVLERPVGSTPFSRASTQISTTLFYAVPVVVVLTLSSAITCAAVEYFLRPAGAAYLFSMLFAATIVATATALEFLPVKGLSYQMRNRSSGRTALMVAVIGFTVLVPGYSAAETISPAIGALDAAIAGTVFLFITLIWNGIREKIDLASDTGSRLSAAQEIIAAALMALVLYCISDSNLFHIIKAP